jgi:hypothetical protein
MLVGLALFVHAPATFAQTGIVGVNFTGVTLPDGKLLNNNNGYAPPDNAGAVGPDHLVQLINGAFAVYDKSGFELDTISGRQFWIDAGIDPGISIANLGVFNQRILYDPTVGRWIAAALTGDTIDNDILIARSDTADPLGTWQAVSFLGNVGGDGKFADFTRLGMDANGVYLSTTNFTENSIDGGLDSVSIFSLPKVDLLAGTPTLANLTRYDALDPGEYGMSIQPVINFGPTNGYATLIGSSYAPTDTVMLHSNLTATDSPAALLSPGSMIDVAQYTNPPRAAQPDGTRTINFLDDRTGSNIYQVNGTIYLAHSTKIGGNAAIKWVLIDEQTNQVISEGVLSDPNFDYYLPSIAANANGDIVLAFTRSGFGPEGNVRILAAVGKTEGGLTTFGSPILLKNSPVQNYHSISDRFGDYTTTVTDPGNPRHFWTFNQFALAGNQWGTQVTEVIVPEPGSVLLATIALCALAVVARQRMLCAKRGVG